LPAVVVVQLPRKTGRAPSDGCQVNSL
jgi:hypothetical protein